MSDYYRRFDTVHDGGLLSKGGLLNENKTPRTNPSESAATRTPSNNGEAKVYFRYKLSPAHTVTIECDLSPGFKLDETTHRLVQGHVRLRCPMPDCPGWMHVWSHTRRSSAILRGLAVDMSLTSRMDSTETTSYLSLRFMSP